MGQALFFVQPAVDAWKVATEWLASLAEPSGPISRFSGRGREVGRSRCTAQINKAE